LSATATRLDRLAVTAIRYLAFDACGSIGGETVPISTIVAFSSDLILVVAVGVTLLLILVARADITIAFCTFGIFTLATFRLVVQKAVSDVAACSADSTLVIAASWNGAVSTISTRCRCSAMDIQYEEYHQKMNSFHPDCVSHHWTAEPASL